MTRALLLAQIKVHEGTGPIRNGRYMPYRDSNNILTIGVGRNLEANGLRESEVHAMLDNDIDESIRACHQQWPWFSHLDTIRQAVVTELVFNMGMSTFLHFRRTIDAIERRDFAAAAEGLRQSRWYQQVKKRRGEKLATQLESGIW